MAIKTAEFEHPEIDKYRIIVPEHLEQDVIRRFHKSAQEGIFATQITANKKTVIQKSAEDTKVREERYKSMYPALS